MNARGDVHAQLGWRDDLQRLFLGLHDVGQRDVTRLVQAQVGCDDRRQVDAEHFQAAVHLAGDLGGFSAVCFSDLDPGGKGGLRQVGQGGKHLAGLVAVIVDGLLAQNDETGLLFIEQRLEQFGDGQRLEFFFSLHQNAPVGTDGHGGAQGFLA